MSISNAESRISVNSAVRDAVDIQANPLGAWVFSSVQNLLTDVPMQFNSSIPGLGTYRNVREKIFGLYIQDDLRVNSRLSVDLGVRYEPTTDMTEAWRRATSLVGCPWPIAKS